MIDQPTPSEGTQIVIEVWSDPGCPRCYVGMHRRQAERQMQAIARKEGPEFSLNPHDPTARSDIGQSVGLDALRIREVLANDEFTERVRADRSEGLKLGATGVPFVVFDRKVAAPGAQKIGVNAQLLDQIAGSVSNERAS